MRGGSFRPSIFYPRHIISKIQDGNPLPSIVVILRTSLILANHKKKKQKRMSSFRILCKELSLCNLRTMATFQKTRISKVRHITNPCLVRNFGCLGRGGDKRSSTRSRIDQHWIEQLRSPPNIITSMRIISAPFLSYLIVTQQYEVAVQGLMIAGVSDAFDGYLARNFNMKTVLGSYLDPLADKVLVNSLAVSLCYEEILPIPVVVLWFLRDLSFVLASYLYVRANTKSGEWVVDPATTPLKVSPSTIGKANTVLQFGTLSVALIQPIYNIDPAVLEVICWTSGGITILSTISYAMNNAFLKSGNSK